MFDWDFRFMSQGGFSQIYIPHCLDEIIPRRIKVAAIVNVNDFLEKYQALFVENKALKEENEILKPRLGITAPRQATRRADTSARDSTNPAWTHSFWPCLFPGRERYSNTRVGSTGSMKASGRSESMTTSTSMFP